MKVELIETPQEQQDAKIEYPCLMAGVGRIIFAMHETTHEMGIGFSGVDLHDGKHSDGWMLDSFKPFAGKVVLSND